MLLELFLPLAAFRFEPGTHFIDRGLLGVHIRLLTPGLLFERLFRLCQVLGQMLLLAALPVQFLGLLAELSSLVGGPL